MRTYTAPKRYLTATGQIDTAQLKLDVSIAEVASLLTKLTRSGKEMRGLCPIHEERSASFYVNDSKGLFYCHGCGQGGDVIRLVQHVGRGSFVTSCEWLVGSTLTSPPVPRIALERARDKRQTNLQRAKAEWRGAGPIADTLGEVYLGHRGIHGHIPYSLRFSQVPRFWRRDDTAGPRVAAMIAAAQDVDGVVTGIMRTFLDREGRKDTTGAPRLALGQVRGCALRLGPVASTVMLAAGIEDALALTRMFPKETVWAAFGDANLPHVVFPSEVRRVVLCGDDDASGRAAVTAAWIAFEDRRLTVEALWPTGGAKDFNEQWLLDQVANPAIVGTIITEGK